MKMVAIVMGWTFEEKIRGHVETMIPTIT